MAFYAFLRSDRDVMGSRYTVALSYPHSQKSQEFRSGDLGGEAKNFRSAPGGESPRYATTSLVYKMFHGRSSWSSTRKKPQRKSLPSCTSTSL
ncbi:hypothetical protein TNCV_1981691 [Trichonephila clavipes]|nr:hypothetical protein TNCV_1981691 [Trichonephila clavipes]